MFVTRHFTLGLIVAACAAPRVEPSVSLTKPAVTRLAPSTCEHMSEQFSRTLQHPVMVDVYATRGVAESETFLKRIQPILERDRAASSRLLDFKIQFVAWDSEHVGWDSVAARSAQLRPRFIRSAHTDTTYVTGLVFTQGDARAYARSVAPTVDEQALEFLETTRLRRLLAEADPAKARIGRVGILTGHGESTLDVSDLAVANATNVREVVERDSPFYELRTFELHGGSDEVPIALDAVLVTQPNATVSDAELRRLDEVVMSGRPLVIIASAVDVKPGNGEMSAHFDRHNLDKLLRGYGVELHEDVVLENEEHRWKPNQGPFKFPFLLSGSMAPTLGAMAPLAYQDDNNDLRLPFASSLSVNPQAQPRAKLTTVAETSNNAVFLRAETSKGEMLLSPRAVMQWGTDVVDARPLGVRIEGSLRSAFDPLRWSVWSRVLVLSSSQYFSNPLARAASGNNGAPTPGIGADLAKLSSRYEMDKTLQLFIDMLDWMTLPTEYAQCRPD